MKLTRAQRAALFSGQPVKLIFPGSEPCPYEVGHIEVLSANVKLEVTEIRRTAEGDHSLGYTLHNDKLGSRFLARQQGQAHPEQYASSSSGGIDDEAGEAVDDFTQRRFTKEARRRELEEKAGLLAAAENVLEAIKERSEETPSLRRAYWPVRRELDRFIENERKKAA